MRPVMLLAASAAAGLLVAACTLGTLLVLGWRL